MEADISSQAVGLASSADFSLLNLFIRADIIVKNGNQIKLIEVKSKSTKSGDEHDFLTKRKPYSILLPK